MAPRKGGVVASKGAAKQQQQGANGNRRTLRQSRASLAETESESEQQPSIAAANEAEYGAGHLHQRTPPMRKDSAQKQRMSTAARPVMTPLGGRKYARGHVDVGGAAATPQRNGTTDAMQVAVSRTPYTARRGIADYEAEKDPIRTYIRLKPAETSTIAIDKKDQPPQPRTSLLQVVSDKEVEISRSATDGVNERYLFTGVVPSLSQQARVFEVCAAPVVRDLASGFNTLLFSYGVSNSGKTYTVQGTATQPGLLPRSVKALLDVLDDRDQQGDFWIRPRYATQVEYCSDPRVVAPTFRVAPGEDAWVAGLEAESAAIDSAQLAAIAQALDSDGARSEWVYQVYVSYFEVYNEMVYDLLDLATLTTVHVGAPAAAATAQKRRMAGGRRGRRRGNGGTAAAPFNDDPSDPLLMCPPQIAALPRTALILRSSGGRRNEAFVDGVTEIRVRTAQDLVRVLAHGQMRRAVHATGLNAGSSRSHALFQAKLVKIRRDARVVPLTTAIPREARASVRTMTIVDLAGSERAKRTRNQGDRLAEAGKINVGLMTLKKCLDVRRFNATAAGADAGADAPAPQLVPYNESKVTRLFQPALEGGAKTVMVVCVDPYEPADAEPAQALAETKNVLDFARVASELVASVAKVADPEVSSGSGRLSLYEDNDDDDEEDDEDEVFFDSKGRRSTAGARLPRKRTGSAVSAVDSMSDAEVDADDVFAAPRPPAPTTSKRQRNGLGGAWQHPAPPPSAVAAAAPPTQRRHAAGVRRPPPPRQAAADAVAPSDAQFSFEMPADRSAPSVALSRVLPQHQQLGGEHQCPPQLARLAAAKDAEIDELAAYAECLEAAVADLQTRCAAAQDQVLGIEQATRAEVAGFFVAAIGRLQDGAAARLHDELARSEAKAAHKIDILSRLRTLRAADSDSDSDGAHADGTSPTSASGMDTAHVPTVSPRTAQRRAVSRAASRKANKFTSISAGDHAEIANLRVLVESLEAQGSSLRTQLEMTTQAREADRAGQAALEAALIESNTRVAALDARLARASASGAAQAEQAAALAHERERTQLLAQISMLKTQNREAETQAMRARRRWETHELLPLQERLRVLLADLQAGAAEAGSADEVVERLTRQKDAALEWWMKEQARVSQVNAQNDVLMREIRHLRARLRDQAAAAGAGGAEQGGLVLNASATGGLGGGGGSPRLSIHTESTSDGEDGSFCKISLRSVDSLEALNGGNPIGVSALSAPGSALPTSQSSLASPMRALDRVVSKGRVLHRNPQPRSFAQESSTDSFNPPARGGGSSRHLQGQDPQQMQGGRAKRVVSRVFGHFANDSRRRVNAEPLSTRPYMAGRFAHTDSAVGHYSTEVLSFSAGDASNSSSGGGGLRARGNTVDSIDSAVAGADPSLLAHQPRVRSTVYSGPIVAHASGGVSVTFTSEEIHDLPIASGDYSHDPLAEEAEELDAHQLAGSTSKRTRSMVRKPGISSVAHQSLHGSAIAEEEEEEETVRPAAPLAVSPGNSSSYQDRSAAMQLSPSAHVLSPPHTAPLSSSLGGHEALDQIAAISSSVAADAQATIKKKRRLHAGRTVLSIGSPDSDNGADDRVIGAPQPKPLLAASASDLRSRPAALASSSSSSSRLAKAALVPQESKNPVLFTPVRTRANSKNNIDADGHEHMLVPPAGPDGLTDDNRPDSSIFATPMKMLRGLRSRKK
ncbi:Kinesin-like protein kif23 [Coemansia sp. RSA 1804]|nr:Kinesin-like protein kif23 [Coemansia sp. RSA 1804]